MKTASCFLVLLLITCAGCAMGNKRPPLQTMPHVELERYMGPWYVIANIPTPLEKDAVNAVESYAIDKDGSIATTFTYNKGSFEGEKKTLRPRGWVRDKQSNAVWKMRLIWPIKSEYRIMYLDPGYTQTVVGRTKRDYVWIMARTPEMPETDYQRLLDFIAKEGYDISKVQKVPQQPLAERK